MPVGNTRKPPLAPSVSYNGHRRHTVHAYYTRMNGDDLKTPILNPNLFNATTSFLIFCLEDLPIFDNGVLRSPTVFVLLSISFLKSSKIFFMYLGASMWGAYIFIMFMSSWWILPLSIMKWPSASLFMALFFWSLFCLISVLIPWLFFPCPFAWNICFQPLPHSGRQFKAHILDQASSHPEFTMASSSYL